MLSGDIVLVKGTTVIDHVIERVEDAPYSHALLIINSSLGIEAQTLSRTHYIDLERYVEQDIYTCDFLTAEQREHIVGYAIDHIGSLYDYWLLPVEGVRYLFGLMLPYKECGKYICSTLCADAYRSCGADLWPGVHYPTPGQLPDTNKLRKNGVVQYGYC